MTGRLQRWPGTKAPRAAPNLVKVGRPVIWHRKGGRLILLPTLVVLSTFAIGSCSQHPATTVEATRITDVSPVAVDGVPSSNYTVTKIRDGTCWGSSDLITGAYRCGVGNGIYDPCWATNSPTPMVLCLIEPWSRDLTQLMLGTSLPLARASRSQLLIGLGLSNGQRCVRADGAPPEVNGRPAVYVCGPRVSALQDINKSKPQWRVQTVDLRGYRYVMGPTERITVAWFSG